MRYGALFAAKELKNSLREAMKIREGEMSAAAETISPFVLDEAGVQPGGWEEPVEGRSCWRALSSKNGAPKEGIAWRVADFDHGERLALRRQDEPSIFYVLSGAGVVTLNGEDTAVRSGSAVFVPCKAEHGIRQTGGERLRFFYGVGVDPLGGVERLSAGN